MNNPGQLVKMQTARCTRDSIALSEGGNRETIFNIYSRSLKKLLKMCSSLRSVRLKCQHSFISLPSEEGFANFCSLICSFFRQNQKEEFIEKISYK